MLHGKVQYIAASKTPYLCFLAPYFQGNFILKVGKFFWDTRIWRPIAVCDPAFVLDDFLLQSDSEHFDEGQKKARLLLVETEMS